MEKWENLNTVIAGPDSIYSLPYWKRFCHRVKPLQNVSIHSSYYVTCYINFNKQVSEQQKAKMVKESRIEVEIDRQDCSTTLTIYFGLICSEASNQFTWKGQFKIYRNSSSISIKNKGKLEQNSLRVCKIKQCLFNETPSSNFLLQTWCTQKSRTTKSTYQFTERILQLH